MTCGNEIFPKLVMHVEDNEEMLESDALKFKLILELFEWLMIMFYTFNSQVKMCRFQFELEN